MAVHEAGWRSAKHRYQWTATPKARAFWDIVMRNQPPEGAELADDHRPPQK
jgi:hypothetical protein